MRTPCQADPDLWTSDKPAERWTAQQACLTCHRLTACATENANLPDRTGVIAGVDYTVSKGAGLSLAPGSCENPRCRGVILRTAAGARRRFCNDKCRRTAGEVAA